MSAFRDPCESFKASLHVPASELAKIPIGYSTPSAGRHAHHHLVLKLQAIASAGFTHIELGIDDLVAYASSSLGDAFKGEKDYISLEQAAATIHAKCNELGLYIATLMPFGPFGGFTKEEQRRERMQEAEGWFKIIKALGNPMLQCGTSDLPDASSDMEDYVKDLQELADAASKHSIRVAYEQWCWGTHFNTWQDSYQIVERANRSNLGVCLDTFQMCGRDYADPSTSSGLLQDSEQIADSIFRKSIKELETIDPTKIFYFQISSASRLAKPLEKSAKMRLKWSDSYRPMPFQEDRCSYLPVMPVVEAVLKSGYRGLFSVETFDDEAMKDSSREIPLKLCSSAAFILRSRVLSAFAQE